MAGMIYDNTYTRLEEGKRYTLNCKDKVFKTDVGLQLSEGEAVRVITDPPFDYAAGSKVFIYNKTAKTELEGYNGSIALQCEGNKADEFIFEVQPMVEVSGWWTLQKIASAGTYMDNTFSTDEVSFLDVPITVICNNAYYYGFSTLGWAGMDTMTYLIGLQGEMLCLGDDDGIGREVTFPLEINFPVPTKVPKLWYLWLLACAGRLSGDSFGGDSN